MALTTSAIIAAGAGVYGAVKSGQAADAQVGSSRDAISEQRRQFDTMLSLTAPQRNIGNQALATLGGIYGYSPTNNTIGRPAAPAQMSDLIRNNPDWLSQIIARGNGQYGLTTGNPRIPTPPRAPVTVDNMTGKVIGEADYTNFFASPDYKFRFQQGQAGVQNTAAAQGGLYSGNALRALTDYGQGMGASEFGNWFNRQAALAGIGQTATNQAAQGALATGANVGNLLVNQGDARASGIIGQTNSITNMVNQLGMLWGSGAFGGRFGSGLPGSTAPWSMSGVPA